MDATLLRVFIGAVTLFPGLAEQNYTHSEYIHAISACLRVRHASRVRGTQRRPIERVGTLSERYLNMFESDEHVDTFQLFTPEASRTRRAMWKG